MFALKFFNQTGDRRVVSCVAYKAYQDDDNENAMIVQVFDKHDDVVSGEYFVGKEEEFTKMYAENVTGKTIDRIAF